MKKIVIIFICLLLCSCTKEIDYIDVNSINVFDVDNKEEFSFEINGNEYMLVDLSEFKTLYAKDTNKKIYPASLTKLVTLDTVLNLESDLDNNSSSLSYEQIVSLINEDASLAGLMHDYEYTLKDLLYALILPSGADAAIALENYFENKNINLIEEMNKHVMSLGCENSNFVNTTGLHDDNHYSSLDDLFMVVLDILNYKEGRIILETLEYKLEDETKLMSTVRPIVNKNVLVLGGKTGYTPESGQSIVSLFKHKNKSYILMIGNAMRRSYDEHLHYDDSIEIFNELY